MSIFRLQNTNDETRETDTLHSIYGICPKTDPTLIGLSNINQIETSLDTPFNTCGSYLVEYPCDSKLGFPAVAGGTFYGPDNLPASGTETLSNLGGTVTSPASGAVFTYTNGGDSQIYTITAANAKNAGSGNGPQITEGSGGTSVNGGIGSPTQVGPAAASGSSGTGGTGLGNRLNLKIEFLIFAFIGVVGHISL